MPLGDRIRGRIRHGLNNPIALDPTLVLDLPFSEGVGSTAHDRSLYGNHGTIYGASWVNGKIGKALSFDGIDDYVEVPYVTSLDITDGITLTAWIFSATDFPSGAIIIGKHPSSIWCIFFESALRPRMYVILTNKNGYYAIAPDDLSLNTWYHIAGTFKRNDAVRLYINGVEIDSMGVPNFPVITNTDSIYLGREYPPSSYYVGVIDEVRIYNRALSATEILRLYNAGL